MTTGAICSPRYMIRVSLTLSGLSRLRHFLLHPCASLWGRWTRASVRGRGVRPVHREVLASFHHLQQSPLRLPETPEIRQPEGLCEGKTPALSFTARFIAPNLKLYFKFTSGLRYHYNPGIIPVSFILLILNLDLNFTFWVCYTTWAFPKWHHLIDGLWEIKESLKGKGFMLLFTHKGRKICEYLYYDVIQSCCCCLLYLTGRLIRIHSRSDF